MLHSSKRPRATSLLALLGLAFGVSVACGSSREDGSATPPLADPDASVATVECGFRCSRDLKKVLKSCSDQSEFVVAECGTDQGCGVDSCVDACESAARAKGSVGCGFWTLPPDDWEFGPGSCFAAIVANTWDRPVGITAEWGSEPLDISRAVYTAVRTPEGTDYTRLEGPLPPGEVAVLFLAQKKDLSTELDPIYCPPSVTPAVDVDPLRHGTARTKAFHIKTDAPVAAYSLFPYGGADSMYPTGMLLLPESSWDKSYIGVTTAKFGSGEPTFAGERTMQIVANDDNTEVSIRPTFDIGRGYEVEPAAADEASTWTLQRGQVLQITQRELVSGSPIQANKPIGLFGGARCANIPVDVAFCDLFQQQIAPFSQWGTEYALVPFRPRVQPVSGPPREIVAFSLLGAVDGTELTWTPARPAGAPTTLSASKVATFMTDQIVSVKSQDKKHPFHASVYMTGADFAVSGGRTLGDPEFVTMVPTDQFLDRYVFFADHTYPDTTLTIVRRKSLGAFRPVTLDCAGELGPFQPIADGSEYEYAWIDLTAGFHPQKFAKGECGYGRHVIESEGSFSIHVWGLGVTASYGYAGGMGARPIHEAPAPVVK